MTAFRRKLTISYGWHRVDGDEIDNAHLEQLEEDALDRIIDQMKDDMTSGELHSCISVEEGDPGDEIEYTGWWMITTLCRMEKNH